MTRTAAQAFIGTGRVRHTRLRPVIHRFVYPTCFLLLPMRSLRSTPSPALIRNRFGLISFFDCDHGDGRADSLAWLDDVLKREGVRNADGEVWLHCYPRVLGFAFKPVSFWYCHRKDGALAAVVVEVNNTFGERHCYLLDGPEVAFDRELRISKVFHVSPFCEVKGSYRFQFMCPVERIGTTVDFTQAPRTFVRIDHHDDDGLFIRTSVSGSLQPLSRARGRAAFLAMPLLTLGIVVRIHWQAFRLFIRRVPVIHKPPAPKSFLTR